MFQEPDLIERTVRDFLTEDVERIVVDSPKAYDRMREMISKISKRSASKVKLYSEPQPIFDRFNITKQLENAFSRQVHLKSGGYIVMDETEALVAIDVNTGRHKGGKDQETTILKVNLEAADEICRQLRLRNMGGLIVLDFIDMKSRRDQQTVYQRMKEGLRRDKAKTHILPISQLGLMEMTRQRHSESVRAAVYDDCPYCKGRGKVKSAADHERRNPAQAQRDPQETHRAMNRTSSCASWCIRPCSNACAPRTRSISSRWRSATSASSRSAPTRHARRAVQDRERREQRGTGQRRHLNTHGAGVTGIDLIPGSQSRGFSFLRPQALRAHHTSEGRATRVPIPSSPLADNGVRNQKGNLTRPSVDDCAIDGSTRESRGDGPIPVREARLPNKP